MVAVDILDSHPSAQTRDAQMYVENGQHITTVVFLFFFRSLENCIEGRTRSCLLPFHRPTRVSMTVDSLDPVLSGMMVPFVSTIWHGLTPATTCPIPLYQLKMVITWLLIYYQHFWLAYVAYASHKPHVSPIPWLQP